MSDFNIPDDMGFLAEDACRQLAVAIIHTSPTSLDELIDALRRFMWEAKKTPPGAGQP